jgi:hypothetical protein
MYCRWRFNDQEGEFLTGLTPPRLCPYTKPGPGFTTPHVMYPLIKGQLSKLYNGYPLYFEVNCKQKEIVIQYSQQVLYLHARRVLSIYTCMSFILRETCTTVREWACCHTSKNISKMIKLQYTFIIDIALLICRLQDYI